MAKGFFVLFGVPGSGKSTEAAQTFQDALYISSGANVLQFYKQLAKETGVALPKKEIIVDDYSIDGKVDYDKEGTPMKISTKQSIEGLIRGAVKIISSERKYRNVIIDEAGTFWTRILAEITPTITGKSGSVDTRKAFGVMNDWSRECLKFLSHVITIGAANVVLIAHAQEPDEERKGGPKFPSQGIMNQICADADGVLLRVVEDAPIDLDHPMVKQPPLRLWRAHASQHWLTKLRGLPDSRFEDVKSYRLKEILEQAGFEP
jgi:hypothetical protein